MTFLTWILVGVLSGLLGGLILSGGKKGRYGRDILVGTIGAFVGGILLAPVFDIQTTIQPSFKFSILTIGMAGAVAGLAVYYVVRRMRTRTA